MSHLLFVPAAAAPEAGADLTPARVAPVAAGARVEIMAFAERG